MDKILIFFAALALGIGALFLPRIARGTTVSDQPKENDTAEVVPESTAPQGSSPSGLRNNNPFNLKFFSIGWVGEIGTDGDFSVFDTAENGIRAGMINIHTKMTRDGAKTVRRLLTILSPAFENPLESFINFVSAELRVSPEQPLTFAQHIIPLSKAIIQFENGKQPFTDEELNAALARTGRI